MTFCIKVKPMEVVQVGMVFALYGEHGELIIANRDKAVVEAALRANKVRPKTEPENGCPQCKEPVGHVEGCAVIDDVREDDPEDEKGEPLPDLDSLSYRDLKTIAKEQEIPHYQRMKRDDLRAAIEKLMAGAEDDCEFQEKSKPPPDCGG